MATAAALRAEAFTVGKDVFFRRGRFEPTTERGEALLAHELVHVRQQTEHGGESPPDELRDRDDAEAEAEAVERLVLAGSRAAEAGRLTVRTFVRNYRTADGRPVARQDRQRLDSISFRALNVCERLLGPVASRMAEQTIGSLQIDLSLDISRVSDDQAAETWGRALADAIRPRIR